MTRRESNTWAESRRAAEFREKGRADAFAGIGINDEEAAHARATEVCGIYALPERSSWSVGHIGAVRDMEAMAVEAATRNLAAKLAEVGVALELRGRTARLSGSGIELTAFFEEAHGQHADAGVVEARAVE